MITKKSYAAIETDEQLMAETDASKEFTNFFVKELKDVFWAEKLQLKLLPKIQRAVIEDDIKNVFHNDLAATASQLERLEQIFELLKESPKVNKCEVMAELAEQSASIIVQTEKGSVARNKALVLAAIKIKHYEIAAYTALVQWARTLGNEDIISLLDETLAEETETGEILTSLGERTAVTVAKESTLAQPGTSEEVVSSYKSVNLTGKKIRQ